MTKTMPTDAQEAVHGAIARFPNGASTEQVEALLATAPNRRTLQQRPLDMIQHQINDTSGDYDANSNHQ